MQCTRVTVLTVLVGISATATWVAAEGQLGYEVDIKITSARYGRHWPRAMSEVCEACGAFHWPQERLLVANRADAVDADAEVETAQLSKSCLTPELHCA